MRQLTYRSRGANKAVPRQTAGDGARRLVAIAHDGMDLMNPMPLTKLDEVIDVLALGPAPRVLDLGCGKGELLRRIAARHAIAGSASTSHRSYSRRLGSGRLPA